MTKLILVEHSEDGEIAYPFLSSSLEEAIKELNEAKSSHLSKYSKNKKELEEWRKKKKGSIPVFISPYFSVFGIRFISCQDEIEIFELQEWFDKKVKNQ